LTTFEMLRRTAFEEFGVNHTALRSVLLNEVLDMDATVADFGAGGGHLASWLNDTGLVQAYAFDGSPDVSLVSRGAVVDAHLGHDVHLFPELFDWVLALDVGSYMPSEHAETFLRNIEKHAKRGAVITWSATEGLNPLSDEAVRSLVAKTSLHVAEETTARVRALLPQSVLVLHAQGVDGTRQRVADALGKGMANEGPLAGCGAEVGIVYGGVDITQYDSVPSPEVCCNLCSGHSACVYWTWSSDPAHENTCLLKSTREHRMSHLNLISGKSK